MSVDIFVHPEVYLLGPEAEDAGEYGDYIQDLLEVARDSELPIGIEGLEQRYPGLVNGDFREEAPDMPWLKSLAYGKKGQSPTPLGAVHPADWSQLKQLLAGREQEEIRVHGTYYNECTSGLAVQVSAYLEKGENLYDWTLKDEQAEQHIKKTEDEVAAYEEEGTFSNSNVWLGITLANQEEPEIAEADSQDFKNRVTSQLSDDRTRIYRLGPEPLSETR